MIDLGKLVDVFVCLFTGNNNRLGLFAGENNNNNLLGFLFICLLFYKRELFFQWQTSLKPVVGTGKTNNDS